MTTDPFVEGDRQRDFSRLQIEYTGRNILAAGGGAGILSAGINALIFLAASELGAIPAEATIPATDVSLAVASVVAASFAGEIGRAHV